MPDLQCLTSAIDHCDVIRRFYSAHSPAQFQQESVAVLIEHAFGYHCGKGRNMSCFYNREGWKAWICNIL